MNAELLNKLQKSRGRLADGIDLCSSNRKCDEEGGCGVVGFCCSEPVPARHIYEPSKQMHNRGNGKGGGIGALGFIPEQLGVSQEVLDNYIMLHIAYLEPEIRQELEGKYIYSNFEVEKSQKLDTVEDWSSVEGLETKPPDVWRYFVRVKPEILKSFIAENELAGMGPARAENEFVNQNSFRLNQEFYASLGEKKAFVLSEGKNIMILKVVGYAEAIVKYYKIENLCAHIWIAHQRFPTRGRVWHPGGAHPFGSINTALVHNGDFANYQSVTEYLAERHIYPQFLTDTETSVLLFDLLSRAYEYPLEYIIEAMAPTSELDFERLPQGKKSTYHEIQKAHIHGSPDGPWFFIIGRTIPEAKRLQLMGITDTAMLRPQVFAFCDGEVQVGLICSEKQAIDATLMSLHQYDKRICPVADRYWNARGGSYTDGGAFVFTLAKDSSGKIRMTCTDKFGIPVSMPVATGVCDLSQRVEISEDEITKSIEKLLVLDTKGLFKNIAGKLAGWSFDDVRSACGKIVDMANDPVNLSAAIKLLTLLNDRRFATGEKKRNYVLYILREGLRKIFNNLPKLDSKEKVGEYRLIDYSTKDFLQPPDSNESTLVIDAKEFPAEGDHSTGALLMDGYLKGWRHFICFNCIGQRFIGCGLGPQSDGVTIEVYDSSGDYLGSGLDGLTISVHGNAQDQVGQIVKSGKMVIYGDVGQTFMYGAKGGSIFVMGNAAGRPLINSVGRPRVVINGTCLDFLAESFMAGDALNGGGFVILNGITFDDEGRVQPLREPYPGGNLFSLASGGAIYIRDPKKQLIKEQLNGGEFVNLTDEDWDMIKPYLEENERLFGIGVEDLLIVDGELQLPSEVYRKVTPVRLASLMANTVSAKDSN